jgi:hypothetical protein
MAAIYNLDIKVQMNCHSFPIFPPGTISKWFEHCSISKDAEFRIELSFSYLVFQRPPFPNIQDSTLKILEKLFHNIAEDIFETLFGEAV